MSAPQLTEGVRSIKELLMDYFDLSEPLTVNDRAALLTACIDLAADLAMVRSSLTESLAADMEENEVRTPYGVLVRTTGAKRKNWDGKRLAHVVANHARDTAESVEGKNPLEVVAESVTEQLIACAGLDNASQSWRAGELKKRDINPNAFCEWVEGTPSVRFQ